MKTDIESISNETIHKELDLIQACISRMANNSFYLKGWLVTLIVVLIALTAEEIDNFILILSTILITLSFWYLDAFFLRTEKMYCNLYEWVITERNKGNIDKLYNLNPHRFEKDVDSIFKVMKSKTLLTFYFIPLVFIIIVYIYNLFKPNCI